MNPRDRMFLAQARDPYADDLLEMGGAEAYNCQDCRYGERE